MEWVTEADCRDSEALEAVRRFVEEHGELPTEDSWTAAAVTSCERTVLKRFGSFRAAAQLAGLDIG
jgi:hypothetical protein